MTAERPLILDSILDDIGKVDPRHNRIIRASLEDAVRLRIADRSVPLLNDLLDRAGKLWENAPYLFWPAYKCWIEFTIPGGDRPFSCGFCYNGDLLSPTDPKRSLQRGQIAAYLQCDPAGAMMWFPLGMACDLANARQPFTYREADRMPGFDLGTVQTYERMALQGAQHAANLILAALAMIGSPKHCERREVEFSRLNKRRRLSGKWPFHAYHEVALSLSRPPGAPGPADGSGPERALHFVRAFLRLRLGKVEFVHPHWRGNAELGIKRPAYVVTP